MRIQALFGIQGRNEGRNAPHQHVHIVGCEGAAAVKAVQPRDGDREGGRVRRNAGHGDDRRVGRNGQNAGFGLTVFQVKVHASGVLEPAQALRLALNDALRLLLVVRPRGKYQAAVGGSYVYAGINLHVFNVVARAARLVVVKQEVIGVHHNVGVVENVGRCGGWGGGGGGFHKKVRIQRLVDGFVHGGRPQHRGEHFRFTVIGDREIAVIHVARAGLK